MEGETEKIKEFSRKIAELFSKKLSQAVEHRKLIRKLLDEQIEKLPENERFKIYKELGEYGTAADIEKKLDEFLDYNLTELANYYYEKLCVDDDRFHNSLWLLGDEGAAALHKEIENQGTHDLNNIISKFMFTFDDIKRLSDHDIQKLLQKVERFCLVRALKSTSKETTDAFLRNMSERASKDLLEQMDFIGNIDKSEVLRYQRYIMDSLEELIDNGEIEVPYYLLNDEEEKQEVYLRDNGNLV